MPAGEVRRIYPRPSTDLRYRQNWSFIDTHPLVGYEFPGFDLEMPRLKG